MTLEIKVRDKIQVAENLADAEKIVTEAVKRWFNDNDQKAPLVITFSKVASRAPPALGIHVSDVLDIGERFG